jgi:hypothetical protein
MTQGIVTDAEGGQESATHNGVEDGGLPVGRRSEAAAIVFLKMLHYCHQHLLLLLLLLWPAGAAAAES